MEEILTGVVVSPADAPTEDAVHLVYVDSETDNSEYSYEYEDEDDNSNEDLEAGSQNIDSIVFSEKSDDDTRMNETEDKQENVTENKQEAMNSSRSGQEVLDDQHSSASHSWDMISKSGPPGTPSASAPPQDLSVGPNDRDVVSEGTKSRFRELDEESWAFLADDRSVAESTHMDSSTIASQGFSVAGDAPKFDFLGVELDLNQKPNDDEGLTVSLCETMLAMGTRTCQVCTRLNKMDVHVCVACGHPLIANPSLNADAELAARFAKEEEELAIALDAELARKLADENHPDAILPVVDDSFPNTGFDESDNTDKPAEDSLDMAHNFRQQVRLVELPPNVQFENTLDWVLLAQKFFARKEAMMSCGKPASITTGFVYLNAAQLNCDRRLDMFSSWLEANQGGMGRGISVSSHPYSNNQINVTLGVLCIMIQGKTSGRVDVNVDTITFPVQKRVLLKRSDQCLPLFFFPASMIERKERKEKRIKESAEDEMVHMVTPMEEHILNLQASLQGILDRSFHSGRETKIEKVNPLELVTTAPKPQTQRLASYARAQPFSPMPTLSENSSSGGATTPAVKPSRLVPEERESGRTQMVRFEVSERLEYHKEGNEKDGRTNVEGNIFVFCSNSFGAQETILNIKEGYKLDSFRISGTAECAKLVPDVAGHRCIVSFPHISETYTRITSFSFRPRLESSPFMTSTLLQNDASGNRQTLTVSLVAAGMAISGGIVSVETPPWLQFPPESLSMDDDGMYSTGFRFSWMIPRMEQGEEKLFHASFCATHSSKPETKLLSVSVMARVINDMNTFSHLDIGVESCPVAFEVLRRVRVTHTAVLVVEEGTAGA